MTRINAVIATLTLLLCAGLAETNAQRPRIVPTGFDAEQQRCPLMGVYRIDAAASDKLYSVVRGATSTVPFGDQQRFFLDLSLRLTPPDLLAIECRGANVSIGSSRAPKVTFVADGKTRRERGSSGNFVYSRVVLDRQSLTFTSTGRAEDNVNVAFRSIDGGRRLHVRRRIDASQLTQPIVIQSFYDRISDSVNWDTYGEADIARMPIQRDARVAASTAMRPGAAAANREVDALRQALDNWIDATNRKDLDGQMRFYMPQLRAFYLTRNTARSVVRLEKQRAFQAARSVDIRAEEPEIIFQDGGRTAIMRFRKEYRVAERTRTRSGVVIQELRWQRTNNGWRIFSERDVRVIR